MQINGHKIAASVVAFNFSDWYNSNNVALMKWSLWSTKQRVLASLPKESRTVLTSLSFSLFVCLSVYLSVCLSVCLSVFLSLSLSLSLFLCKWTESIRTTLFRPDTFTGFLHSSFH